MQKLLVTLAVIAAANPLLAEDQWAQFRGPEGNGHTRSTGLSLEWGEEKHVVWKTPIHDRGWSSPVIWDSQIWMTTATKDGRRLFAVCVDKDSGKVLHDIHVFDVDLPMPITSDNTYATPTPVIEDGRVYIHYGTYGTAALDTATGRILWTRRDLNCDHENGAGPASSPFLVGNSILIHVDGRDVQYVIAIDKVSGKNVWKSTRSVDFSEIPVHQRKAYCMPILIPRGDGKQLISVAAKGVFAYDPATGEELWKVRHKGWSIAPRPVFGNGLVFAIVDRDHPELWAIRPDGSGDVTDSHVVWKVAKRMPPRAAPLLVGDLVFLVNRNGIATCLEAKTGKIIWQERVDGAFSASPIYANGRIYLFNEDAVCTVIKAAREFEILVTNSLAKEPLMATPAIAGNALFIRTEKHIYRIQDSSNPAN
jgi:outer membrane protein assembly factor BamB